MLFLRHIDLEREGDVGDREARHLVFDACWSASTYVGDVVGRFPRLETLILSETEANDLMSVIETLPSTIRRVHILLHEIHVHNSRVDLPHLEFFTFTWLQRSAENGPQTSADDNLDALEDLRRAVNSIVNAPQCTFKYLRSTESPEDALADALAALKMDL
jgi:hypothetical protein